MMNYRSGFRHTQAVDLLSEVVHMLKVFISPLNHLDHPQLLTFHTCCDISLLLKISQMLPAVRFFVFNQSAYR
jgi:hypothetical protein